MLPSSNSNTTTLAAGSLLSSALKGTQDRWLTPSEPQAFLTALSRWRELLGTQHVLVDEATLERYAQSTLPTSTYPCAILRPQTTREVSEIAKIAQTARLPLHAISCGKNWGYGSACAPEDGWVIVDLGRMNRILEFNEELAYAVIEPGVTQGQLAAYLQERDSRLMLDVTGAGPDASIVGNTLQRGFGHTPYGNHFTHQSGMEVVLPDGEIIRTGFGACAEQAKCRHLFPWGQGPTLDGIFTQSHLGMVTSMGIWLMPQPEVIEAFAFSVPHEEQLGPIIDNLRQLRLQEIVRSTVHIANDLRVISAQCGYPEERCGGVHPLPDAVRLALRKEHGVGAWNIMGGLYGSRSMVAAAKRIISRTFRPVARVQYFTRAKLNFAKSVLNWLRPFSFTKHLRKKIESASSVFDLLCGIPARDHLRGSGWRQTSSHPDQAFDPNSTGLIWVAPAIPATAAASREVAAIITQCFQRYGFDPLMTISTVTERANVVVSSINYDSADAAQRQAAQECERVTKSQLAAAGYFAYRTSVHA